MVYKNEQGVFSYIRGTRIIAPRNDTRLDSVLESLLEEVVLHPSRITLRAAYEANTLNLLPLTIQGGEEITGYTINPGSRWLGGEEDEEYVFMHPKHKSFASV